MLPMTNGEMALTELERHAALEGQQALAPMDETAFRAFYDRTARMVWVYLSRVTGDSQLADDLLQETYYRFYRAGAALESESHRRNYLFRVATNLAHDSRRQRKRGEHVPLNDDLDLENAPGDDGLSDRVAGRTDLRRAMQKLSPSQREMLWLAYGVGSSHAEIAATVGVKTSSVKLLLFRARKKLATLLTAEKAGGGHP